MSNHKPGVVCYQCPECKMRSASDGYRIGVTDGERLEREAIVAWLRKWAGDIGYLGLRKRLVLAWMIDYIERGEHLRGEHLIGGPVIDPLRGAVATGYSIGIKDDDDDIERGEHLRGDDE